MCLPQVLLAALYTTLGQLSLPGAERLHIELIHRLNRLISTADFNLTSNLFFLWIVLWLNISRLDRKFDSIRSIRLINLSRKLQNGTKPSLEFVVSESVSSNCRKALPLPRNLSLIAMSTSVATRSALSIQNAAWTSLVSRSIASWDELATAHQARGFLQQCDSLDDFLQGKSPLMFWFFQLRSAFASQKRMKKWSRDNLDDYILLPASNGFVMRSECFFVSHFWQTKENPDPVGTYLRLHQKELEPQNWSYIWVDWTCMPQEPRSGPEEAYFKRCLKTVPSIIRNCGFIYFYPPYEPRLWILYEVTEYVLTCDGGLATTPDVEEFLKHVDEMIETGVQATLAKHGYGCSFERDKQYLTSWLELIVLMRRLSLDVGIIRQIMDHMTWFNMQVQWYPGMELRRFDGVLVVNGVEHKFTPFPQWVSDTLSCCSSANENG